jgi:hypothetical protein
MPIFSLPIPIVVNSFASYYKNRLWRNEVAQKKRERAQAQAAEAKELQKFGLVTVGHLLCWFVCFSHSVRLPSMYNMSLFAPQAFAQPLAGTEMTAPAEALERAAERAAKDVRP